MSRLSEKVFCAFCRTPRRVYRKRHLTLTNVLLALLASALLMLVAWQSFDPRVFVIFILSLSVAEAFIQIRWRLTLPCPYCGFDAALYLKDKGKAAMKVKRILDERQQKPMSLLSKHDPIRNLKAIQRERRYNGERESLPTRVDLHL